MYTAEEKGVGVKRRRVEWYLMKNARERK